MSYKMPLCGVAELSLGECLEGLYGFVRTVVLAVSMRAHDVLEHLKVTSLGTFSPRITAAASCKSICLT